ncbi:MAG: FG-GAP-like repeat-containing protein [Bryobacteraceae bacterium]|nr:FG-GAP-like repeat-containing protein [Bryobacteraceae bacterium]
MRAALLALLPAACALAQVCPTIDFLSARNANMIAGANLILAVTQRPDSTYSAHPMQNSGNFRRYLEIPNYAERFALCLPLPPRRAEPLNVVPPVGAASGPAAAIPDAGNGTPVGAWTTLGGTALQVFELNRDYTFKARTNITLGPSRQGVHADDFDRDGRPDLAVLYTARDGRASGIAFLKGNGDGSFAPPVNTTFDANFPLSFARTDFNGDGRLDLAVGDNGGRIYIFNGVGDGTFRPGPTYALPQVSGFASATSVAAGDVTGDGRADLVVANGGGRIAILQGNADGTFAAPRDFEGVTQPQSIALGDFNRDGRLDIAVSSQTQVVGIALNQGNGVFRPLELYVANYDAATMQLVDFNRDGHLDVVIGEGTTFAMAPGGDSGFFMVLLGNGDGTLVAAPVTPADFTAYGSIAGDFNGDSRADIVVTGLNGDLQTLLVGANNRPQRGPRQRFEFSSAAELATGDFNADGRLDLVIAGDSSRAVLVLAGNGQGGFTQLARIATPDNARSVSVADYNGDNRPDIVVAYRGNADASAGGVRLHLNQGGSFSAATEVRAGSPGQVLARDLDGDGRADILVVEPGPFTPNAATPGSLLFLAGRGNGAFADPVTYRASIRPVRAAAADLNADGRLDLIVLGDGLNFSNETAVLLGQAGGRFGAATIYRSSFGPSDVAVADFDGDGRQDVITAHCCGSTDLTARLGNGDGTLQPEAHFSGGGDPSELSIGDLNADGQPDLVVRGEAGISILINNSRKNVHVVSSATFDSTPAAPDSIVTIRGSRLATDTGVELSANLPTNLAGTMVRIRDARGIEHDARMSYASPGQINMVVPAAVAPGLGAVTVTNGAGLTQTGPILVEPLAPAIYALNGAGLTAAWAIRVRRDGTQTYEPVYEVANGAVVAKPIDFGEAGDQIVLEIYGTGLRSGTGGVVVRLGGSALTPAYAGRQPDFPGLDQVNVNVPASFRGRGAVSVVFESEGRVSNATSLTFR